MAEPGEARLGADKTLFFAGHRLPAAFGRGGMRGDKQEGDFATPTGLLKLRRVLWRADRGLPPRTSLPREPIAPEDGWCDQSGHVDYNHLIRLPHAARHERLWREDALYDIIVILGWNDDPVQAGRGSAIFLHVARPDMAPTDGCVALSYADLRLVLAEGLLSLRIG